MKHIKLISNICILVLMLLVSACSIQNEGIETPVFPEEQQLLPVKPGETVTLKFSANHDWKLYSSALWCKFSNNLTSINGKAGDVSVPLTINEDTWGLDDEVAEISLKMGNEEMVIAKYSRAGFSATISDVNGTVYTEDNPLAFNYKNGRVENIINFSANFDWKIEEETLPEWIEIDPNSLIGGKAGSSINVMFNVPKKYWINSNSGTVTVKSMVSPDKLSIPVAYAGIPEGVVEVDGINGNPYWWEIAADGSYFAKEENIDGSVSEQIPFPFSFNVLAKDNAYKVIQLYQDRGYMFVDEDGSESFLSITDDLNGSVSLNSAQENTSNDRIIYLLVMPNEIYDMAKSEAPSGDLNYELINTEGTDINPKYEGYVVLAFKQKAKVSDAQGFIILNQLTGETIECFEGDAGTGFKDYFVNELFVPVDMIYSITVNKNISLNIDPILSETIWDGSDLSFSTIASYFDGTIITNKLGWNPIYDDSLMRWKFGFNVDKSMYIVFRAMDYTNKKALIIQVNE